MSGRHSIRKPPTAASTEPPLRALVTGVTGFIGRELAALLVAKGWEVTGSSRTPTTLPGVAWHPWDAADVPDPALLEGVDLIFHLAGKAHALAESRQREAEYDRINYGGTARLLEAAANHAVKRFIYFSSVKAAGDVEGVMDCSVAREADTPYGRSKRKAERLLLAANNGIDAVILRPTMVYGPTTKGNLPRMIRAIRRGWFPPLPDCGNRRSMVHVGDVARAARLVATHPQACGNIYIITDGQEYGIHQMQRWIGEALGRPPATWTIPLPLLQLAARLGDGVECVSGRRMPLSSATLEKLIGDARYDGTPLQQLGFTPQHTLQEAMPDIVRFVINQEQSQGAD